MARASFSKDPLGRLQIRMTHFSLVAALPQCKRGAEYPSHTVPVPDQRCRRSDHLPAKKQTKALISIWPVAAIPRMLGCQPAKLSEPVRTLFWLLQKFIESE